MSVGFGRIGGARGVGAGHQHHKTRARGCPPPSPPALQPSRQPPYLPPSASQHGRRNIDDKLLQSVHHRPGWSILRGACRHGACDWSGARETAQNGGQGLISCLIHGPSMDGLAKTDRQAHDTTPGGSISNRRAMGPGAQPTRALSQQLTVLLESRHQTPLPGQPKLARGRGDEGAATGTQPWPAAGARHAQVPGHEGMSAVCAGGPYCAEPVLVRPRPARSRLVGRLSVCHFSASAYRRRRRRGALLDPVCLRD